MTNFVLFDYLNGKYHKNQVVHVLPYQFEPEPGLQTSNSGDESDSEEVFEAKMLGAHVFEAKMLGALKAWAGVNVGIAHWNQRL